MISLFILILILNNNFIILYNNVKGGYIKFKVGTPVACYNFKCINALKKYDENVGINKRTIFIVKYVTNKGTAIALIDAKTLATMDKKEKGKKFKET